jgi:hypothetical protein
MARLSGAAIHRAGDIPVRAFDRAGVEAIASVLERRMSLAMSVSGDELYVTTPERTFALKYVEHRIE